MHYPESTGEIQIKSDQSELEPTSEIPSPAAVSLSSFQKPPYACVPLPAWENFNALGQSYSYACTRHKGNIYGRVIFLKALSAR